MERLLSWHLRIKKERLGLITFEHLPVEYSQHMEDVDLISVSSMVPASARGHMLSPSTRGDMIADSSLFILSA